MLARSVPAFLLLLALCAPARAQEKISGAAAGLDEDSIALAGGYRVRLWGIDAPELAQTCRAGARQWNCGREAARQLDRLVAGKTVTCIVIVRDVLRRAIVGDCTLGGQSLSRWMVANGWAVVNRTQTRGEAYIKEEDEAREAKRGIWGSQFEMPWDYKIRQRLKGQPPPIGE